MKTFYQFLTEAPSPPSKPPAGGSAAPPSGASPPPSGGPPGSINPSGPPIGLGGGGPPIGGLGGPPSPLGGPMASDPQSQPSQTNAVPVQRIKSKDVWEALKKSLGSKKSRQEN